MTVPFLFPFRSRCGVTQLLPGVSRAHHSAQRALSVLGLGLTLGSVCLVSHAQTQLQVTKPATIALDKMALDDGGLAQVTPLGNGRVSSILTALYQNYVALHPIPSQAQLDTLAGTLLKTGTQGATTRALSGVSRAAATAIAATMAANATTSATLVNPAPVGVDYAALSKVGATPIRVAGDRVLINVSVTGDVAMARQQLEALGMQVNGEFLHYLGGTIPIAALGQVAQLSNVVLSNADHGAKRRVGATTSQGDVAQRSNTARTTYSVTGTGQKVGVLSDSFDRSTGSYSADRTSGDLPAGVTVLSEYSGAAADVTDEGRAMLQIVYDVAPGAALAFATAYESETAFAQNIVRLRNTTGCNVIVDDIGYFDEPFFMDGPIAQAVDTAVAAGAAYFSAAGNSGRASYENTFRSSGITSTINGVSEQMHNFNTGTADIYQEVTIPAGETVDLVLQWDDPFKTVATSSTGAVTDLDIFLYNSAHTSILARSATSQVGGDPCEILSYTNSSNSALSCAVAIGRRATTSGTPYLKYLDFDGYLVTNEYATNSGTSTGHPNAASCEAVGAAFFRDTPAYGATPPVIEDYSSAGGVAIHRDTAGNFIGAKLRNTPDIVAPDGGNTSFFGEQLGEDTGTQYPNFFGTSAAAPHAAGVAALMLQANSSATPTQIYRSLERTAVDMGAKAGYDYDSGYGLINANLAVQDIMSASSATTGALISEFRERGSGGTSDEYVELYNPTSNALNISGWKLQYTGGGATQTLTVAANTSIPAYGHYLVVGSAYSLANYGGTNAAAGNQTFATPIDDASPLTLLNASSVVQDAVTFGSSTSGLTGAPTAVGEYAFVRQFDPTTGTPMKGATAFVFVATNGGTYTATLGSLVAALGAPGPENLSSPIFAKGINVTLLNPSLSNSASPNRVRSTTATGTNATNGTLSIRRMITNNTGVPITRLRFRITNLTTLNSASYSNGAQADLRLLTSPAATQSITVNGQAITVYGTTLLSPPTQASGGGINSSSVESGSGTITLSVAIPAGQSRAYDFTFGVQRSGDFAIALLLERLAN